MKLVMYRNQLCNSVHVQCTVLWYQQLLHCAKCAWISSSVYCSSLVKHLEFQFFKLYAALLFPKAPIFFPVHNRILEVRCFGCFWPEKETNSTTFFFFVFFFFKLLTAGVSCGIGFPLRHMMKLKSHHALKQQPNKSVFASSFFFSCVCVYVCACVCICMCVCVWFVIQGTHTHWPYFHWV